MVNNAMILAAQNILAQAPNSAGVNLLVVPDSVAMGDNPAITIKQGIHVGHYRNLCNAPESVKYVDPALLANWPVLVGNIAIDTILVQEGVMGNGFNAVLRDTVIWHELGHVLHGRTENAQVFLHELNQILNVHGQPATQAIVTSRRPSYNSVPANDVNRPALALLLLNTWNVVI